MTSPDETHFEGGCTCGAIRYRVLSKPLFVHCCHCTWCQRETGSAFAINALIEAEMVEITKGTPVSEILPSASGQGQKFTRCPDCGVTLWSNYAAAKDAVHFLRVGTLDDPDHMPPNIHIFTSSKQDWVHLSGDVPVMADYYRRSEHWPPENVARYKKALGK